MTFHIDLNTHPSEYEKLASEPEFSASVHLALEHPSDIISLTDFGYSADDIADCPSDFAVTNVFRILSEEGAACLYEVAKQLEAYTTSNPRIERCTRGGVYRSRFLRDLCLCPEITDFISGFVGVDLLPHTMPHQLGHLNFAPKTVGENIDKWHVDTLRYDYVMFVTDPKIQQGGAFQYFRGTKQEVAACRAEGRPLPAEKIMSPEMPGPGYAIMQQGNMVVHQAKALTAPGERITMVNGYIPADPAITDYTRYDQLTFADPVHIATAEYSRHVALHAQRTIDSLMSDEAPFDRDRNFYRSQMETLSRMFEKAASDIAEAETAEMEHFGD